MAAIASQLVFHPSVNQSLKYAATTVGRDKLYRAVQFFARFYAWYLTRKGTKEDVARWSALKSHLGTARKLMRLGKPIEHLQAALKTAFAPAPPIETIASVARQIAYFTYLSYDVVVWANSIKFITLAPETAKRVAKASFRFWFAGIAFSLVSSALKLSRLAAQAKKLKESRPWGEKDLAEEAARETKLEAVQTARLATRQQLTIDLLDVWIPATGAELVNINEGTLGLLGLASSILGIKSHWNSVNGKK
ncbi:peroxisomal biogenesis factor 11 [Coprinopsis marcescibilis]|uniref:Peroxisomal biogenesis factor 11 n=1 Tax=Coprinopsis marcescibilis TaxID=230819 RepID=A0A5C3LD37_COPMA|nr:peroxisomal biogenesis factor 11 [Coprinopsis marcescibilis]